MRLEAAMCGDGDRRGSGAVRRLAELGSSLLELQIALVLAGVAVLSLGAALATTGRHLDRLEQRQRTAIHLDKKRTRASLSEIRTAGSDMPGEAAIKIISLVKKEECECLSAIIRRDVVR